MISCKNIFKKCLWSICLLSILISCSEKKEGISSAIIAEDKMAEILTDIHIAEAYVSYKNLQADFLKQNISNAYHLIFKNYQISEEQFEESFDYYSKNPDKMVKVYDQVLINLSKKEAESASHS